MKKLIAFFGLLVTAMPAFAVGTIPEPEVLPLLGAAALAFAFIRRSKK